MRKQIIAVVAVLAIAGVAIWYGIKNAEAPGPQAAAHTFTSESGESIDVVFEGDQAILTGAGYEDLVFTQTVSGSGARYENEEHDLILWNKGNEVSLYAGDEMFFSGLTEDEAQENEDTTEETDGSIRSSVWVWQYTELKDKERMEAPAGERFVLTFEDGGNLGSTTDCNSIGGNYVLDGEVLSVGQLMMTKMYCEGSMEADYADQLGLVSSYSIEGDTLRLNLNRDYGVMVFNRQ